MKFIKDVFKTFIVILMFILFTILIFIGIFLIPASLAIPLNYIHAPYGAIIGITCFLIYISFLFTIREYYENQG